VDRNRKKNLEPAHYTAQYATASAKLSFVPTSQSRLRPHFSILGAPCTDHASFSPRSLGKKAKIWYHRKDPKSGLNKTPKSGKNKTPKSGCATYGYGTFCLIFICRKVKKKHPESGLNKMPKKIDIEALIEPICKCRSQGMSIRKTAAHVGIHRDTLRNYLKAGEHAKSGEKRRLWIAWNKGEGGMIFKVSQNVVQRATEMGITKIQETEKVDKDGNISTEIKTVKTGPDAYLALKILEKFDPDWGRFEDEPSADTHAKTDTGSADGDKKTPLERQIEGAREAFQGLEEDAAEIEWLERQLADKEKDPLEEQLEGLKNALEELDKEKINKHF
ncbi:MAG: hypothetical protein V6Z82_04410, partial [Flavobacteriales bacterium]